MARRSVFCYRALMTVYTLAQAMAHLPDLIERARAGEHVVISESGAASVEIKPLPPRPRPMTDADLAWLNARRVAPMKSLAEDATTLVSRLRDGDRH